MVSSEDDRNAIIQMVCKDIECKRIVPAVYRKEIKNDNGDILGSVEVLEGEEVVDSVVRFIRSSNASLDDVQLKNYFLSQACNTPRLKCTRNIAVVFERMIVKEDGSKIGKLIISENEEPADKIYHWCFEHGLGEEFVFNLIQTVCDTEGVLCNRDAPLVFGPQPIPGQDGNVVGNLEVKLRQEPADSLM